MTFGENTYARPIVARAAESERSAFIRRTYAHLAGAILAFAGLEYLFFGPLVEVTGPIVYQMAGTRFSWLIVLVLYMGASWLADKWARSDHSVGMQYAGLILFVVVEAIIFLPLLWVAIFYTEDPGVLPTAAVLTGCLFAGLTGTVFITRKDFNFLRAGLAIGFMIAMGLIVIALVFGFSLGAWFSVAMIILAAGAILYKTSNVMLHYRTDQHVAASLTLFAAIALLFWYVLRLLLAFGRD